MFRLPSSNAGVLRLRLLSISEGIPRGSSDVPSLVSFRPVLGHHNFARQLCKLLMPIHLEMEPHLGSHCAGRHEVRPAKRGEKVVQRLFVRQIDHGNAQTPLVPVAVEEVVFT